MKAFQRTVLSFCFYLPAFVSAAEPPDLAKLRRDYSVRMEAASKPVRAWYAEELERLQKSLTTRGDLSGALAVQRERAVMLIGGTWAWRFSGRAGGDEITFNADGSGKHTNSPFQWQAAGPRSFTITLTDGRRAVITFNEAYSAYRGTDFDGKTAIEGERK